MAFSIKKIFEVDEDEQNFNGTEDEFYTQEVESVENSNNKMILLEPRAYSESQQIADYLKCNSSVVVNLKRVTPDQAKRIVDFLSGTLYAIEGDLQKLGGGIFLCTPKSINVEGKITDDTAKAAKGKTKSEEDEFNW